jgi:DNA-binding NarL/FixJ family response regulator
MNPSAPALVCIIDDHRLLGQLVSMELGGLGFETRLFEPGPTVTSDVISTAPALVLLDLELGPEMSSTEACRDLVAADIDVVLFTGVTDRLLLASFLEIGVKGIVAKSEDIETLGEQVRRVLAGEDAKPSARVRQDLLHELDLYRSHRIEALKPFRRLSRSEAEILALIVGGVPAAEIAEQRYVSMATVRAQIRAIHSKLGVSTQLGAAAMAAQVGWSLVDHAEL